MSDDLAKNNKVIVRSGIVFLISVVVGAYSFNVLAAALKANSQLLNLS